MKLRFLILAAACSVGVLAFAQVPQRTYLFYVNGDSDYVGPTYSQGRYRLADNSRLLYEAVVKQARRDLKNRYGILFDPRGRGYYLSSKQVRLEFFQNGKKLKHSVGLISEVDATRALSMFLAEAKKVFSDWHAEQALFYFYGEHPGQAENRFYDESHPQQSFLRKDFLSAFQEAGLKFHSLVMHSCYVNDPIFLGSLSPYFQRSLVPKAEIINAPLDLSTLEEVEADPLEELKVANEGREIPFQLLIYDNQTLKRLAQVVEKLESLLDQGEVDAQIKTMQRVENQRESYFREALYLPRTQEYLVPMTEYLVFLMTRVRDPLNKREAEIEISQAEALIEAEPKLAELGLLLQLAASRD